MRLRAVLSVIVALGAAAPATALASPYADAVTASAPSGWWRLGDAAGPQAANAAGGSAGTWSGALSAGAPGALAADANAALAFSGGWLDLGTTFAPTAALSLESWVRLTSASSTRYIFSQGGTSTGFHLYTATGGAPVFVVTSSAGRATVTAPSALSANVWHHVAATFAAGTATLYVDGAPVALRALSGMVKLGSGSLYAGRYAGGGSTWRGALDELAVYDRALSPADVADHASRGRDGTLATAAVAGPPALTDATSATFALTASDPQATFTCALDGAAATACGAAPRFDRLAERDHVLRVTPIDRWGRAGQAADYRWRADHTAAPDWSPTPPETRIAATVPEVTARPDASFALSATKPTVTFACALDSAGFAPCGETVDVDSVGAGDHVLRVVATDRFGQSEPVPAQYSWRVDRTAPDTFALAAGPAPGAAEAVAVFASSERGGRFECRVDGGGWSACAGPLALPGGATTLAVRAIDAAGNVDPSPATVQLTRETPDAEPTGARSFTTASAALSFAASAGGALSCRLDGGDWSPCDGPVTLAGLAWGEHGYDVRADFPGGLRLEAPELRWTAAAPGARVAALQFPVLLHRARDGRARSRGRPPTLRFALNVAAPVSVRVERLRGRRSRALSAWTVPGRAGDVLVRLPDRVVRRLRRGRYRISAQPAAGAAVRVAFAVV